MSIHFHMQKQFGGKIITKPDTNQQKQTARAVKPIKNTFMPCIKRE